jgi:hypothetical protein
MFIVGALIADPSTLLKQGFDAHALVRPIWSAVWSSAIIGLVLGTVTSRLYLLAKLIEELGHAPPPRLK